MTAVTKCYPGKHPKGKGDRKPSRAEQKLCRPFLDRELALVQPRVILAVGGLAIETLLDRKVRLDKSVGRVFEVDRCAVLPLPHPSGASLWPNRPENQALIHQAMVLLRDDLAPLLAAEPEYRTADMSCMP
jgi:uracil-DNA glycosylase